MAEARFQARVLRALALTILLVTVPAIVGNAWAGHPTPCLPMAPFFLASVAASGERHSTPGYMRVVEWQAGKGWLSQVADITEQKRARRAVEELAASLEAGVEARTAELKSSQEALVQAETLAARARGFAGAVAAGSLRRSTLSEFVADATKAAASVQGTEVEIAVLDHGRGIPETDLKRIFDPFFTTRLGRGGTGLGLGICHSIVTETLGDAIRVASTPGEGSTFTVRIPLRAPAAAGPKAA